MREKPVAVPERPVSPGVRYVRDLLRTLPLPKAARFGIVVIASLDWLSNLTNSLRVTTPFDNAVQVALLSASLLLAWRPIWGTLLLLGLLPVTLQLEYLSVAVVPISLLVGVSVAVCRRPVIILVLLGICAWLVGCQLTGNAMDQTLSMALFWVLLVIISLATRRVAGERSRDQARLRQLEIERAEIIDAERRAIARELHDVVAHAVSVIAVQARAAKFDRSPDAAGQALDSIGDLSREALADLRRLLRVLASERDPGEDSTPAEWNVFDLRAQLLSLVDTMTSLGIRVDVSVPGEDPPLPRSVATAIFRVAQEATTNVIKHAGPDAGCSFRLNVDEQQVELVVYNCPARATVDAALTSGFGLDSMMERVHMFDGTLQAGPEGADGWQVRAVIPLRF